MAANTWAPFVSGPNGNGGAYNNGNYASWAGTVYYYSYTFSSPSYGTSWAVPNNGPAGSTIEGSDYATLLAYVNYERTRRYAATTSYTYSGTITPAEVNALVESLNVAGTQPNNGYITPSNGLVTWPFYGYSSAGPVGSGTVVASSQINTIINHINNAAAACTCNCNYCTCNCNYCTCNCNYACTCNCNYSDRRVKTGIKYLREESGLKLYSFKYIWDKSTEYIGVMAQDLLGTKFENAVIETENGLYAVDYSKLPFNMQKV